VMDADGGNVRRLTDMPAATVRWSPDGTRIGFQSSAEDEANRGVESAVSSAIYVIDSDGRRQRREVRAFNFNFNSSCCHQGTPPWGRGAENCEGVIRLSVLIPVRLRWRWVAIAIP